MSALISSIVRGMTVPVERPMQPIEVGPEGIAIGTDDRGRIAVAVRHSDGTVLIATLDDEDADRFAHRFADLIVQGNASLRDGGR